MIKKKGRKIMHRLFDKARIGKGHTKKLQAERIIEMFDPNVSSQEEYDVLTEEIKAVPSLKLSDKMVEWLFFGILFFVMLVMGKYSLHLKHTILFFVILLSLPYLFLVSLFLHRRKLVES
jgi:hypothetical protein